MGAISKIRSSKTNEITDITGDEIRDVFANLSQSNLIVSLMPVAIELAADMYETDINIELVLLS